MTNFDIELNDYQKSLRKKSMPAALDLAAEIYGDCLAIAFIEGGGPTLTWAQFRDQVSRVRSGLEAAGVKSGDRVAVQLRNQIEFPLTWFAVVELGAAIVPLNPKYTTRESLFVMNDAGASWLIADADILLGYGPVESYGPVPHSHTVAVRGDELDTSNLAAIDFENLLETEISEIVDYPGQDSVANIQFTSGTTGLPKGCILTHRYWVEFGAWNGALFDAKRILADHPFYYMQNQAYLMAAMGNGGAIYVTAGLSRRKFIGWLVDHDIDYAWVDEEMVHYAPERNAEVTQLKRVPVSAVPPAGVLKLESTFGLAARNFYASTEIGNGTFVPWDRPDLAMNGSMGFCFPTRESKIVDANLDEVPPGQPGELCMRGEGMMLGYHNRPDVNQEVMLPGGWFRTGDLVRKSVEGVHFFEGRLKDMVRRSGENISSAEVEMQILSIPEVAEVGVVPVPDRSRGEEVKAVIVLKEGATLSAAQVVSYVREGLAAFKVPRYVEFRDALPHTGSGKVHKASLKAEEPFSERTIDVTGEREHAAVVP